VYKQAYDLDVRNEAKQNFAYIINKFGIPNIVVEIGALYGITAIHLTENLVKLNSNYTHYCIDPFENKDGEIKEDLNEVYKDFKANVKKCAYGKHIKLIKDYSHNGLIKLKNDNIKPELIYIDGDHKASTVLSDLVLSFDLLIPGGVIICDDSVDFVHRENNKADPQMSPRMAVEAFIMCNWNNITPLALPNGFQTAFIKKSKLF
jgi:predicted O-methyltransferase YrrM